MTFLSISLLVFSVVILTTIILLTIWWKKYGKSLFSTFKSLTNTKNPQNMMENMINMENITTIYKNMGNFNQRMGDFAKKITKKK